MKLPPAQTADVQVQRDLRVPMRDGVTLLADRYAPAGVSKLPLVLVRCPYGRRGLWGVMAGRLFAERGFQSVVQSCRGTFGSGGRLDPFGLDERDDGLATVEWLREQPWYPGSFGTWGPSYLGMTQWALARLGLPDHKAMAIQVSGTRPRDIVEQGGSFALETMLEWVDQVARQERPGAMFLQGLRARAPNAGRSPAPRRPGPAGGRAHRPVLARLARRRRRVLGPTPVRIGAAAGNGRHCHDRRLA
jgi:predicted acyl esterase